MKTLVLALISFLPVLLLSQELQDSETMPFFSMKDYDSENSNENLFRYIQENLGYPEEARDNCQTGTVILSFSIDTFGNVIKDSLWYNHYPLLIEASKKTIYSTSGSWVPGSKNGEKKEVKYVLPFRFNVKGVGCKTEQDYYQLGLRYFKNEDFLNAVKAFKLAFRIDPYNTDYIYNTAVGYLKQYKIDSACKYLNIAVKDEGIESLRIRFCEAE